MEVANFNYSMKNIGIGNEKQYRMRLYEMTTRFIERIRWKAFFYDKSQEENNEVNEEGNQRYGFPTRNKAPANPNLELFEKELYQLIKSIKFRKVKNNFFKMLNQDIKNIKKSDKVYVFADKTNNIYKMGVEEYKKLLLENVTASYKEVPRETVTKINDEAVMVINKVVDVKKVKIPKYDEKPAFITIKDHKPDFPRKVKCRLLNPSKTHIARISKIILDKINATIRKDTGLQQWKRTAEVIEWFNSIDHKHENYFLKFDIVDFYPSIQRKTVINALKFAKKFIVISKKEEEIVFHACKSILTHDNRTWVKTTSEDLFDVPMGSFHGAELCELVGLFLLNKISRILEIGHFGIYRDDGLAIIQNRSGPDMERLKKSLHSNFKEEGFRITIDLGMKKTDFLDVSLDLDNNTFKPFRKDNASLFYIDANSNHPRYIKNELPRMVEKRISSLSANSNIFDNAMTEYSQILKKSNYKQQEYQFQEKNNKKKRRSRKVIYFQPPFNISVQDNIGKKFIELINKHFQKDHIYYKIFNKNTIKLSYCCMNNMKSIINSHNRKIVNKSVETPQERKCNCRGRQCPLNGQCLQKNIIYEATVSTAQGDKYYVGSTGKEFKTRYNKHMSDFRNKKYKESTTLSAYIWGIKSKNIDYNIKWKILHKTNATPNTKYGCSLCNLEKLEIARACKRKCLNKRSELQAKCPHFRNYYL